MTGKNRAAGFQYLLPVLIATALSVMLISSTGYADELSFTDTVHFSATCADMKSTTYSYDKTSSLKGSSFLFHNTNTSYQLKLTSISITDRGGTRLCDYGGSDAFPQVLEKVLNANQKTAVLLIDLSKDHTSPCKGLLMAATDLDTRTKCQFTPGGCGVDEWGGCAVQYPSCKCTLPAEKDFQVTVRVSWAAEAIPGRTGEKGPLLPPEALVVKQQ